jgi:hypothetical protein
MASMKAKMQIGRMVYAYLPEGERYYLRVLLNHVRGATSFNDLKTIGTTLTSFHDFFTQYIFICVVVRHKNSILFVWLYLSISYVFGLGSICFTCFVGTINDHIEHDDIFRWSNICHVLRGM